MKIQGREQNILFLSLNKRNFRQVLFLRQEIQVTIIIAIIFEFSKANLEITHITDKLKGNSYLNLVILWENLLQWQFLFKKQWSWLQIFIYLS